MQGILIRIAGILKSALFPNRCLACESLFFHTEDTLTPCLRPDPINSSNPSVNIDALQTYQKPMAPFLCHVCIKDFLPVTSPLCPVCGLMFQSRAGEDHLCGDCLATPRHFHSARAAGVYDQTLKTAIHHLKYKGKIGLAKPLGRFLFMIFFQHFNNSRIDLVVPVPLHIKKMRQRGFNQAFLLIREWEKLLFSVPGEMVPFRLDRHSLIRGRQTQPQTGLNRKERHSNIKEAFTLGDLSAVKEKNILLVDDVYTTGSTVDECAKVLLSGGARKVDVLTLARAW